MPLAGTPVDDYDKACRDLSRCYKCLENDYQLNPEDKYRWSQSVQGEFDCSDARNSEAQKAHCECDAEFANTMGANWDDAAYDYTKWDDRRNDAFSLDKENYCVAGPNAGRSDECCGVYPQRFPYIADMFECCSDGVARLAC